MPWCLSCSKLPVSLPFQGCLVLQLLQAAASSTHAYRVPWCLSYLVLAHAMWTLVLHYRSYAMLRVLHLRFGPLDLQLTSGAHNQQAALAGLGGV